MIHIRVAALIEEDALWLRYHPNTPQLYSSGVRYGDPDEHDEVTWMDIPSILAVGYADCKSLAAWRIAELRMRGVIAQPEVSEYRRGGDTLYHVLVRHRDNSLEDPSRILGM